MGCLESKEAEKLEEEEPKVFSWRVFLCDMTATVASKVTYFFSQFCQ